MQNATSTLAPPESPLGELTTLPRTLSWILWDLLLMGMEERTGERDGMEGKGRREEGGE